MHLHIASGCFARASSVDVRKPGHGCSRLFKKKHAADIHTDQLLHRLASVAEGLKLQIEQSQTFSVFNAFGFLLESFGHFFGYILNM